MQPHDAGVRLGTARILRVAANVDRMTGLYEEALPLYREATYLLKALADESPTDLRIDDIRTEMAFNAIDTGEHLRMSGQHGASKAYFQNALDALDGYGDRPAESASRNRLRAMALLNLASAMNETGHYDEAKASTSRAIELLLPSAGEGIDHPEESLLLILAQDNLAVAERELLNRLESSRVFDPAIARASALNAKYSSPDIKRVLATVQNDLGELLAADPAAERRSAGGVRIRRRDLVALARAYPHIPGVRRDFAVACNGIGGAFIAIRRAEVESDPQKAKQHLESALGVLPEARKLLVDLLKSRELFDYESQLGRVLANLARIALAKETATRPALSSTSPPSRIGRQSQPTRRVRSIEGSWSKSSRNARESSDVASGWSGVWSGPSSEASASAVATPIGLSVAKSKSLNLNRSSRPCVKRIEWRNSFSRPVGIDSTSSYNHSSSGHSSFRRHWWSSGSSTSTNRYWRTSISLGGVTN